MTRILVAVMAIAGLLALTACATSTVTLGRDFSTAKVSNIVRGKTASSELKQMFGEPYSKSVISETGEIWAYYFNSSTVHGQSVPFATKFESTGGQTKALNIFIKDGVVTNYTFTEGTGPAVSVK